MKIASIQMQMSWTLDGNVQTIIRSIESAATQCVDLVLLPELAVTGFHRRVQECCAAAKSSDTWLNQLQQACQRNGVAAWIGMPRFDGDTMFNSYVLIGADGTISAEVRKNGLTETEAYIFEPATVRDVVTVNGANIAIILCREIVDLELISDQLHQPVDLILWPGYISHEDVVPIEEEQVTQAQAALVAKSFQAPLVQCNWANSLNDPDMDTTGGSVAITAEGEPFFRAPDALAGTSIINVKAQSGLWIPS